MDLCDKIKNCVEKALKRDGYVEFRVDFPDLDTSGGYSSEIIHADVTATKNDRSKNVFQLLLKRNKTRSDFERTDMRTKCLNEVNVYTKFIPAFKKFADEKQCDAKIIDALPKCYGTVTDEDEVIIILENLKPRNYKLHDSKKALDLNHTNLTIQAYAEWHALWLALKDQQPKTYQELISSNVMGMMKMYDYMVETMKIEIDNLVETYKEKNDPNAEVIIEKLEVLKANYEKTMKDCLLNKDNEDYAVIRHGDCWTNNYLFQYDSESKPKQVVIIDWQISIPGSPLADLTYFLFQCCSRKELEHLDELLKLYHETFSNTLRNLGCDPDNIFPWEVCLRQFKKYLLYGLGDVPAMVKLGYVKEKLQEDDIYGVSDTGNYCGIFEGGIHDPEGYFDRVDGIFKFCIDNKFL